VLTETYTFENTSPDTVEVMQLGIQTPLNDIYNGALYSLSSAVNAHLFTGGAWAWALAQPMNGEGSSLGLIVRKGQLWSYSLESASNSNIRGNIVLQVTDATRNPDAFGGQPTISIKPGDSYILEWDLAFYNSSTDFIAATQPPATFSAFAVPLADSIVVETPIKPTSPSAGLRISHAGHNQYLLSASSHGAYQIDIGHARTEVSFHLPLETIVQLRTQYILAHQRSTQRPPPLNYAFVSVDTQNYTTVVSSTWPDWGDGSERIAMPTLLQLAAMRGWVKKETVEVALQEWVEFASTSLFDAEGNTRRCTSCSATQRPYDAVWLVMFFNDRYSWLGNSADLDTAVTLLNRAFQLGYVTDAPIIFLSFAVVALSENLDKVGRHNESSAFQNQVIAASSNFVNDGENIPASEVSYEQSIVEPLVEMTADTYRWTNNQTFLDATKNQLSWLLAFQGPQPHTRLFQIANRHWDDYWFGLRHQWGDVFPHYWSALTSEALIRLPTELRTKSTDAMALNILRANMVNFSADGAATCAFVYPSAVNNASANAADLLANDQDWHLVIWMRLLDQGVPST
jgi:hypothetical protein